MQSIKLYYNKLCVFLKSKNGVKFSVCIGLLGLLLILLSDCSSNSASDSSNAVSTTEFSSTDYKKDLEDSLCNLIPVSYTLGRGCRRYESYGYY